MSTFWSFWIIILTTTNLVLLLWILFANRKKAVPGEESTEAKTTGHEYDGIEGYAGLEFIFASLQPPPNLAQRNDAQEHFLVTDDANRLQLVAHSTDACAGRNEHDGRTRQRPLRQQFFL